MASSQDSPEPSSEQELTVAVQLPEKNQKIETRLKKFETFQTLSASKG